jgi:DDE superfamily endonuclease
MMTRPNKKHRQLVLTSAMLLEVIPEDMGMESDSDEEDVVPVQHRKRTRRYVNDIFNEQGPIYVRRAYRMQSSSFWELHRMLKAGIAASQNTHEVSCKTHKNGAKNGLISTSVRLSVALRYFAGGRPDDIALVHGISHSEVFNSVWKVVDAVNSCKNLNIGFPQSHTAQRKIARAFELKSDPSFTMCAGCLDGMLIWMEKPSAAVCKEAKCGAMKFFCGRKKKFGVNLQGVCDVEGRFIDVSIGHPASTSDYLAFSTSKLYYKLEEDGFLAPGLTLFGDLAYVNTGYMATPFKGVKSGTKDDYNFFHSQVCTKRGVSWTFGNPFLTHD